MRPFRFRTGSPLTASKLGPTGDPWPIQTLGHRAVRRLHSLAPDFPVLLNIHRVLDARIVHVPRRPPQSRPRCCRGCHSLSELRHGVGDVSQLRYRTPSARSYSSPAASSSSRPFSPPSDVPARSSTCRAAATLRPLGCGEAQSYGASGHARGRVHPRLSLSRARLSRASPTRFAYLLALEDGEEGDVFLDQLACFESNLRCVSVSVREEVQAPSAACAVVRRRGLRALRIGQRRGTCFPLLELELLHDRLCPGKLGHPMGKRLPTRLGLGSRSTISSTTNVAVSFYAPSLSNPPFAARAPWGAESQIAAAAVVRAFVVGLRPRLLPASSPRQRGLGQDGAVLSQSHDIVPTPSRFLTLARIQSRATRAPQRDDLLRIEDCHRCELTNPLLDFRLEIAPVRERADRPPPPEPRPSTPAFPSTILRLTCLAVDAVAGLAPLQSLDARPTGHRGAGAEVE
ncbi:hypothetical protein MSAN_02428200 [Mycena sanguinolenta]|uniref:Uncharacterized protein n=1 Tax=Mycena sanguinolenta TaxID=230812 RepID=A0A8H6X2I1_9AGAR|nr:hypothetical protein MSAN_02428200 [Mycena sanguinolenta]